MNSGALSTEKPLTNDPKLNMPDKAKSIYIWGSNSSCFIPYLPNNLILDTQHLVDLDKIFKDSLALPEDYEIVDIQMTDTICSILVSEFLDSTILSYLDHNFSKLNEESFAVALHQ
jgi:hypothetical protein